MKTYFFIIMLLVAFSCNKNDQMIDKSAEVENADPTALLQGASLPSDYVATNKAVVQALTEFDATLTAEKVRSYNYDIDRVIADMNRFVDLRISQQSPELDESGARTGSPDPSDVVTSWVNATNSKFDALEAQIDADKITDDQAKISTVQILSIAYNQVQIHPSMAVADKNSLLGSHYSANSLLVPVESILQKFAQSSPNGRATAGWLKKLRKAVTTFVRVVVVKTVVSFAKGCFASGSIQGCIPGGVAKASADLASNAQEAIKKAAGTIH